MLMGLGVSLRKLKRATLLAVKSGTPSVRRVPRPIQWRRTTSAHRSIHRVPQVDPPAGAGLSQNEQSPGQLPSGAGLELGGPSREVNQQIASMYQLMNGTYWREIVECPLLNLVEAYDAKR